MKNICVYCGSSPGNNSAFMKAASDFGRTLAVKGLGLVYGGARVGLMGAVADSILASGGRVTGVMPEVIVELGVAHSGLTDLRVVRDMYERKQTMIALSDGFIALPGGYGTFDELFDALSQAQLGIHGKPCGLLDVDGYFTKLLSFLDVAVAAGFLKKKHLDMLIVEKNPDRLIERFFEYEAPAADKLVGLL
jgi:uncharacterized protein (TIGR00730 family)